MNLNLKDKVNNGKQTQAIDIMHENQNQHIGIDLVEEVIEANSNDSTERIFDYSRDEPPCFVSVHIGMTLNLVNLIKAHNSYHY